MDLRRHLKNMRSRISPPASYLHMLYSIIVRRKHNFDSKEIGVKSEKSSSFDNNTI